MKYAVLSLSLLTLACGKIETGSSTGLGSVRQLQEARISTADALAFDQVCQALTKKQQKLQTSLPNSLSYDVVEKDCSGNTTTFGTQQVRVEAGSSGGFQLRRTDNNVLFVFSEVETADSGFMKEICGGASTLPVSRGSEAVWVSLSGFSSSDCPAKANERCLQVEYGVKQENGENIYRVHTREFVRINLISTSGKYGYVTYRKSLAENDCDQGKNTTTSAELR